MFIFTLFFIFTFMFIFYILLIFQISPFLPFLPNCIFLDLICRKKDPAQLSLSGEFYFLLFEIVRFFQNHVFNLHQANLGGKVIFLKLH